MDSDPTFWLIANQPFLSALIGWFSAQSIKLVWHFIQTRRIDFKYMVSTGGMPSAHSAMATALATSVGIVEGARSPIFAIAVAFAGVVMFDAQSVRRAAGMQARLLNQIVEELFQEHHLSRHKLAELLGHTRVEVFAGLALGIGVAFGVHHWLG